MKKTSIFSELEATNNAPYGIKKDGKPRKRRGADNLTAYHQKKKEEKLSNPQYLEIKPKEAPDKSLNILQKDLHRLGREAIKTLRDGLRDQDVRVRIQAATAATRTSVLGLAKDLWAGDGLASIGIYHSAQDAADQEQAQAPIDQSPDLAEPTGHPRTGRPVTIIR